MYSRKVASSQVMPESLLAADICVAGRAACLAADQAVQNRPDADLCILADLVTGLADAENLLACAFASLEIATATSATKTNPRILFSFSASAFRADSPFWPTTNGSSRREVRFQVP